MDIVINSSFGAARSDMTRWLRPDRFSPRQDQSARTRQYEVFAELTANFPTDALEQHTEEERYSALLLAESSYQDGLLLGEGEKQHTLFHLSGEMINAHTIAVFVADPFSYSSEELAVMHQRIAAIDALQPHPEASGTMIVYTPETKPALIGDHVSAVLADTQWSNMAIGIYPLNPDLKGKAIAGRVAANIDRRWRGVAADLAFDDEFRGPESEDVIDIKPDTDARPTIFTKSIADLSDAAELWREELAELAKASMDLERLRWGEPGDDPFLQGRTSRAALRAGIFGIATTSHLHVPDPPEEPPGRRLR
ncbi:MAG: hypothetical protein HOQ05_07775 [Corynebacteriales bacterium]|nr:hypothetical protein [Mycobacteriales bacterium]